MNGESTPKNKPHVRPKQRSGARTPPAAQPPYYEDEINLLDLWLVLRERKGVVLGVFLITVLFAVFVSFLMAPVYESRAVIEIGQVGQVGLLEQPAVLVKRLKEKYRVDDSSEGPRAPPYIESVSLDKKDPKHVVGIKARGETAEEARRFLTQAVNELLAEHKRLFDSALAVQKAHLSSLKQHLDESDRQIMLLSEHINALKTSDPAQSAILVLERGKLLAKQPDLESQETTLTLVLSKFKSRTSRLLRPPTLPVKPVRPKPKLYTTLGAVLGLMLGIFAAFFAEFLSKASQKLEH